MSDPEQSFVLDKFKLCAIALYGETIVIMGSGFATAYGISAYADTFVSCAAGLAASGGAFALVDRPIWRYVERMYDLYSPE